MVRRAHAGQHLTTRTERHEQNHRQRSCKFCVRLIAQADLNDKQESPPAWTQEAYRPPCSDYSFCCHNWVPSPPTPSWLQGGYPTWIPPPAGYPLAGYPPGWTTPTPLSRVPLPPGKVPLPGWTWQGTPPGCLPRGILGNVAKHYGIWVPPLWTDRLMDGWKDRCVSKHYLPVVLRTRAVIMFLLEDVVWHLVFSSKSVYKLPRCHLDRVQV